ncbi:MAG TPA: hypothetical protein VD947_01755, partial [Patescibacteria group bacterium]|nr:hypothetical protein [Patescibacteria group bacterium]
AHKIVGFAAKDKEAKEYRKALENSDYGKIARSVSDAMWATEIIKFYADHRMSRGVAFNEGVGKTDWGVPGKDGKSMLGSMPIDIYPGSESQKTFSSLFLGRKGRLPFDDKNEDTPYEIGVFIDSENVYSNIPKANIGLYAVRDGEYETLTLYPDSLGAFPEETQDQVQNLVTDIKMSAHRKVLAIKGKVPDLQLPM